MYLSDIMIKTYGATMDNCIRDNWFTRTNTLLSNGTGYMWTIYSPDGNPNIYVKKFLSSVSSLKKLFPDARVAVYTNINDVRSCPFITHFIYDPDIVKHHIAKVYGLLRSPFNKTVYLDCDIYVERKTINNIFTILDEFNFAAVYGANDTRPFQNVNSGIFGVAKNDTTNILLMDWIHYFETHFSNIKYDQPALYKMYCDNKKEFYMLPYQFMLKMGMVKKLCDSPVTTHHMSMKRKKVVNDLLRNDDTSFRDILNETQINDIDTEHNSAGSEQREEKAVALSKKIRKRKQSTHKKRKKMRKFMVHKTKVGGREHKCSYKRSKAYRYVNNSESDDIEDPEECYKTNTIFSQKALGSDWCTV